MGNTSSVDIANWRVVKLVQIGEKLLEKPLSRVNLETGRFEEVKGGGTNAEALTHFAKLLSKEKKLQQLLSAKLWTIEITAFIRCVPWLLGLCVSYAFVELNFVTLNVTCFLYWKTELGCLYHLLLSYYVYYHYYYCYYYDGDWLLCWIVTYRH